MVYITSGLALEGAEGPRRRGPPLVDNGTNVRFDHSGTPQGHPLARRARWLWVRGGCGRRRRRRVVETD